MQSDKETMMVEFETEPKSAHEEAEAYARGLISHAAPGVVTETVLALSDRVR